MFRKDRLGRRGGGVILYIKESIQAYEIQLVKEAECEDAVWCNIVTGKSTLTVGLVYRSPNISMEENEKIHKRDCIIMGDQEFFNLVQDSFLSQHVLEATRGENVLDTVLSSQKEFVDNVKICEPLGCSDHNQIHFIIKVKGERNRKIRYRKIFHKGRYKDMREYLAKIDWNNTLKNKTATECWNILKSEIDCVVDKFVPLKKQGKRSKKKHLSKEAIRKIKYKQMMWKTYRHTGSEEDYSIYKEALNQATAEIRNSKRSYEQKIAFNIKHDSKSFYAYVRSKQKVQDKVGPLEGSDGNIITEGFLMAENLNEYFSSVFTREDISILPVLETKFKGREFDYLGQLIVTPTMVAMKIRDMKDNKSPGVDGIPPKLLLEIVEQISIPLATVFNLSLEEGIVPLEWKEANIIPLFKKGSRNKSENYRPVSLTSVICKLLERLIKDHLVDFLVKNKLINPSQHGFLKARSCLTNMLCFLEDVTKWLDEGSPVDIIYLDFKKAFDKVPHQRLLLLKLKAHGIGNGMINWIEKWLIGRRQRVVVDGEVSNWKPVLSGVPQGSVLGPILFLIYINDLDDDITSKVLKFADDTKVFRKIKSDADRQHLQDDLNKLIEWSEKWQMLFNFGKCKCLHTGHGNEDAQYTMGDTVLNTTSKEKDLGLTISADMKVSEQCGIAAAKGNQILGLIRRNIVYKEKELIIPLYKTIVRPHLEYCIQAWRPYRKKDIDMLERVQRRATNMIPKLRNISYEMRLKECGLTTLETRRLRGDQIEVFKILNGYENIDRNILFTVKEERRTRGHGVTLAKKQCRLDIRKFSFSQRTVNEWNRLSADCVGASSVNIFKNKIDIYLRRAGYT